MHVTINRYYTYWTQKTLIFKTCDLSYSTYLGTLWPLWSRICCCRVFYTILLKYYIITFAVRYVRLHYYSLSIKGDSCSVKLIIIIIRKKQDSFNIQEIITRIFEFAVLCEHYIILLSRQTNAGRELEHESVSFSCKRRVRVVLNNKRLSKNRTIFFFFPTTIKTVSCTCRM